MHQRGWQDIVLSKWEGMVRCCIRCIFKGEGMVRDCIGEGCLGVFLKGRGW